MDPSFYKVNFKALGSHCEIVISCLSESIAHRIFEVCINEVRRFENKYSRYIPDSITSRINNLAKGEWIECDEETQSLLNYADTLYRVSEGLFDITSGAYRKCWDFNSAVIPDEKEIKRISEFVGWDKVERRNNALKFHNYGMEIDFGGFGKEYEVDKVANIISSNGVNSGFVNFGGDLRVLGPKVNGEAWLMGILDPNNPSQVIASIPITYGALATSGNYEKFFDLDGKRYCHIINPKTGMPVTYWKSISIMDWLW